MAAFEWRSVYATQLDDIDGEHKNIIASMNRLAELSSAHADHAAQLTELEKLLRVTVTHFAHEEQEMKKAHYADFDNHQKIHQKLLEQLKTVHTKFVAKQIVIDDAVLNFCRTWLAGHILGMDKKYVPAISALRGKSAA